MPRYNVLGSYGSSLIGKNNVEEVNLISNKEARKTSLQDLRAIAKKSLDDIQSSSNANQSPEFVKKILEKIIDLKDGAPELDLEDFSYQDFVRCLNFCDDLKNAIKNSGIKHIYLSGDSVMPTCRPIGLEHIGFVQLQKSNKNKTASEKSGASRNVASDLKSGDQFRSELTGWATKTFGFAKEKPSSQPSQTNPENFYSLSSRLSFGPNQSKVEEKKAHREEFGTSATNFAQEPLRARKMATQPDQKTKPIQAKMSAWLENQKTKEFQKQLRADLKNLGVEEVEEERVKLKSHQELKKKTETSPTLSEKSQKADKTPPTSAKRLLNFLKSN